MAEAVALSTDQEGHLKLYQESYWEPVWTVAYCGSPAPRWQCLHLCPSPRTIRAGCGAPSPVTRHFCREINSVAHQTQWGRGCSWNFHSEQLKKLTIHQAGVVSKLHKHGRCCSPLCLALKCLVSTPLQASAWGPWPLPPPPHWYTTEYGCRKTGVMCSWWPIPHQKAGRY